MSTTRLEAFSDGVIAILITIMVLELKTPQGHDWTALRSLGTKLSAYVLSFVIIGIYWSNHHHMIRMTERVNGAILWMNPSPRPRTARSCCSRVWPITSSK